MVMMMVVVEKITVMIEEVAMLLLLVTWWTSVVTVVGVRVMKRTGRCFGTEQLLDQRKGENREKGGAKHRGAAQGLSQAPPSRAWLPGTHPPQPAPEKARALLCPSLTLAGRDSRLWSGLLATSRPLGNTHSCRWTGRAPDVLPR